MTESTNMAFKHKRCSDRSNMNVLLLISVFDVKEQESTGHYHS